MEPFAALGLVAGYFLLLMMVAWLTGKKADNTTFFTANRSSPWFAVAFGMIGASLSGVTFISVPGAVGAAKFGYFQVVLGYLLGYLVIATVLLPLYYRMNLTSIYQYLETRFGPAAYKSGAVLFILSRIIGASLRLYLVAMVLFLAICQPLGISFEVTTFVAILLIYLYTFRGGIKTVVWTDTLQTASMLLAAGITVYLIGQELNLGLSGLVTEVMESEYAQIFFWEGGKGSYFWKQFFSGAFLAIVMTGLDQDMMQKNLTCRNLQDAQKNMFSFSIILVFANLLFLGLGALLYIYGTTTGFLELNFDDADCPIQIMQAGGLECIKSDKLFPLISLEHLGPLAAGVFTLGVIAAAYSSADSALTALTTSFCVDILDIEKKPALQQNLRLRYGVHVGFAVVLFVVILIFERQNDDAVIWAVLKAAGYTYGPLLGLYSFGLFTRYQVRDEAIPWICVISPILSYGIQYFSPRFGYTFGTEILILNGLLTILGLMIFVERQEKRSGN
ncbi:MAG: sodium:solute symporter [Bacteroidota bacterium]